MKIVLDSSHRRRQTQILDRLDDERRTKNVSCAVALARSCRNGEAVRTSRPARWLAGEHEDVQRLLVEAEQAPAQERSPKG